MRFIWYLISITKADEGCDLYYYSSKFNGIVFNTTGVTNIFTQVNSWAETLDEIVATEKLSEEINLFSNQSGISIDLVRKSLEGYFIEYKTLFSKHKLTNVEICDCLLKNFIHSDIRQVTTLSIWAFANILLKSLVTK